MKSKIDSRNAIKAKIKYSANAIQDLEGIGDYIADTLKSLVAALNTVGRILDAIDRLTDFPLIGSPLSLISESDDARRFLI